MATLTDEQAAQAVQALRTLEAIPMGNAAHYYVEMLANLIGVDTNEADSP